MTERNQHETVETTPSRAAALLRWYQEIGVDVALQETPVDRFAESAAPPPSMLKATRAAAAQSAIPRSDVPEWGVSESDVPESGAPESGVSRPNATRAPASRPSLPERNAPGARSPAPRAPLSAGRLDQAAIPDDTAVANARELAAAAASLDELRRVMEQFEGCNLRLTARSTVFADGNPDARVMLIGEAPGRDEDVQGLPFVGRSGQLLDRMLAAVGLNRTNVYITNVIAWRPPGNRTPTPQEAEICKPFIERHVELVGPEVIGLLGGASTKLLTGASEGIIRLRGRWMKCRLSGREIDAIAMLHPAHLLRQPAQKRHAWQDMLKLKVRIDRTTGE